MTLLTEVLRHSMHMRDSFEVPDDSPICPSLHRIVRQQSGKGQRLSKVLSYLDHHSRLLYVLLKLA